VHHAVRALRGLQARGVGRRDVQQARRVDARRDEAHELLRRRRRDRLVHADGALAGRHDARERAVRVHVRDDERGRVAHERELDADAARRHVDAALPLRDRRRRGGRGRRGRRFVVFHDRHRLLATAEAEHGCLPAASFPSQELPTVLATSSAINASAFSNHRVRW